MRYIKPPDFKSVKDLQEHYKKLEQDITDLLFSDASINTAEELNKKLSLALSASLSYLTKINKTYVEKELPIAFKEGQASSSNLKEVPKKTASAILAKQGFKYDKNGFSYDTYIELQTATKTALNGIKTQVNDIIKDLRKDGQDSLYNVRETLLKELQQHNLTSVKYSNGAEMPLNAYAAMVARSARIETTNISAIGGALEDGTDLVKMTSVSQCCKLCGAYQGKVYSITGKDKRFPSLFKTVLKNGYALPHPNCRHEFIPWFEEAEAPEDVEEAIKNSKIKYDGKGNLVDVRYKKDIEAYQAWQAGNRQLNREMLEFEKMQAYYESKGETPPYSTLGAFRRARRADNLSTAFKAWRYRKQDEEQYEELKQILGVENSPKDLDSFVEIKYNKNKKAYRELIKAKNNALLSQEKNREPKDFVLSKTVSEAERYMAKRAKQVSFDGITNVKSLNQANRTYAYLADKYNLKQLNEVSTKMRNLGAFAESHGDVLHIGKGFANNPKNNSVVDSSSGWVQNRRKQLNEAKENLKKVTSQRARNAVEQDIQQYEEDLKYSRHNVIYEDQEIESVVTHEVGHIIAEQKFQHLSRSYANGGRAELIRNTFKKAQESGDIYNISCYANKNVFEFFAESFTIYEMEKENLPAYIEEMVMEAIK